MIKIFFEQDADGNYYAFQAIGHADYAKRAGDPDIVCAGITALLSGLITSVTDILKLKVDYTLDEGNISCKVLEDFPLKPNQQEALNLLFSSYETSCAQIALSYGKKFVQIKRKNTRRLT